MNHPQTQTRRRQGRWAVFTGITVVLCVGLFLAVRIASPKAYLSRYTVVVHSSPVEVWSLDPVDKSFIVITLPSDTTIEALYGYGMYSIDSLWKLGEIEKIHGVIVADSLSDSLGIPISWYIAPPGTEDHWISTDNDFGSTLFTYKNTFSKLLGRFRTNMPLDIWIAFAQAISGARVGQKHTIEFTQDHITNKENLPDGSSRRVLDRTRVDYYLNNVFTSERFRKENVSVTLFNTTDVPLIGNKAARFLTSEGIMVASIRNDAKLVKTCTIRGMPLVLVTKTAVEASRMFHCSLEQVTTEDRSDLMIYLGSDFAQKYKK